MDDILRKCSVIRDSDSLSPTLQRWNPMALKPTAAQPILRSQCLRHGVDPVLSSYLLQWRYVPVHVLADNNFQHKTSADSGVGQSVHGSGFIGERGKRPHRLSACNCHTCASHHGQGTIGLHLRHSSRRRKHRLLFDQDIRAPIQSTDSIHRCKPPIQSSNTYFGAGVVGFAG